MPRLSEAMEEGTVLRWLVEPGDEVAAGQPLVEIETDKANVTHESPEAGVVAELLAAEGETLRVGEAIARFGSGDAGKRSGAVAVAAPRRVSAEVGAELAELEAAQAAAGDAGGDPPEESSIPPDSPPAEAGIKGDVTVEQPTRTERTTARRMAESKATAPDFDLRVEVDMTDCAELRRRLEPMTEGAEAAPGYADMVVKACALALGEHPRANAAYRDGAFERYSRVNVGVVVATDAGLVVPTIFDAATKSLGQIAAEARALEARARSGEITQPELAGGTFTVSDLGAHGVDSGTAIVNPPQAAGLAIGAVARRAVVDEHGRIAARETMTATLACDHRILSGPLAAAFLGRVRELLESPLSLNL